MNVLLKLNDYSERDNSVDSFVFYRINVNSFLDRVYLQMIGLNEFLNIFEKKKCIFVQRFKYRSLLMFQLIKIEQINFHIFYYRICDTCRLDLNMTVSDVYFIERNKSYSAVLIRLSYIFLYVQIGEEKE